jgi:hypothetical protein
LASAGEGEGGPADDGSALVSAEGAVVTDAAERSAEVGGVGSTVEGGDGAAALASVEDDDSAPGDCLVVGEAVARTTGAAGAVAIGVSGVPGGVTSLAEVAPYSFDSPVGRFRAWATSDGLGFVVPGTVARAAPVPKVVGSCRLDPSTRSGTSAGLTGLAEPVNDSDGEDASADEPGGGTGIEPDTEARPLTPPLTGALLGVAQRAPGAGGGGGENVSSPLDGVGSAGGLVPLLSGVVCRSFMEPPDRRLPTVASPGADHNRAISVRVSAPGTNRTMLSDGR